MFFSFKSSDGKREENPGPKWNEQKRKSLTIMQLLQKQLRVNYRETFFLLVHCCSRFHYIFEYKITNFNIIQAMSVCITSIVPLERHLGRFITQILAVQALGQQTKCQKKMDLSARMFRSLPQSAQQAISSAG